MEPSIVIRNPLCTQAVIIYVPIPQQKVFQKIQIILVRELEKKFSGKHVVVIAERKILPKPTRKARNPLKQKRPRSRTLTAVYDAILEDLVFPAEIVGKRIRVKLDGSQLVKVHLDKNQQTTIEHKVSISILHLKEECIVCVSRRVPSIFGPSVPWSSIFARGRRTVRANYSLLQALEAIAVLHLQILATVGLLIHRSCVFRWLSFQSQ